MCGVFLYLLQSHRSTTHGCMRWCIAPMCHIDPSQIACRLRFAYFCSKVCFLALHPWMLLWLVMMMTAFKGSGRGNNKRRISCWICQVRAACGHLHRVLRSSFGNLSEMYEGDSRGGKREKVTAVDYQPCCEFLLTLPWNIWKYLEKFNSKPRLKNCRKN